jgi:hypothetical protein
MCKHENKFRINYAALCVLLKDKDVAEFNTAPNMSARNGSLHDDDETCSAKFLFLCFLKNHNNKFWMFLKDLPPYNFQTAN